MVIVTTLDPVTGSRVINPEKHPFVVEGNGVAAMRKYFESGATRQAYLAVHPYEPGIFDKTEGTRT